MTLPSSSRNGQRVRLVVLHTAEGAQTNASLFSYFDRTQNASSHVGIDDAGISDVWVPYDRAAWTLRGGNPYSENAEMCAWARWTRAEWLTHDALLSHAAAWVRSRCLARGIPIVKLSPAEVKAGKAGVCGHADYTYGTGDGTHTDPGPNFPWDIVISRAKAGAGKDEDMPLNDADKKWIADTVRFVVRYQVLATKHIAGTPDANTEDAWTFGGRNLWDVVLELLNQVFAANAKLDGLTATMAHLASHPDITPDALQAAMQKAFDDALARTVKVAGDLRVVPATAETLGEGQ